MKEMISDLGVTAIERQKGDVQGGHSAVMRWGKVGKEKKVG